jgi:hypothetical protein
MILLASRGDSSPAAQAEMTADDALVASAALSILRQFKFNRTFALFWHQRAQQCAQDRGIPSEALLDRLGAQCLALDQHLDGSRNPIACPFWTAARIAALPRSNGRPRCDLCAAFSVRGASGVAEGETS